MINTPNYPKEAGLEKVANGGFSDNISNTAQNVAKDVSKDIKSIKDSSVKLAHHLRDDAMEIAHSASAEAQSRYDEMKVVASDYLKTMEREVSAKPVRSVAIAFAAGAALSLLFGRR